MYLILPDVRAVLPGEKNPKIVSLAIDRASGKIARISPEPLSPRPGDQLLEAARGLLAFPGFIDPHVHFRTPGKPEAEDWRSGSMAALFAGITTVLDMPNTNPPTIDENSYRQKKELIQKQSRINYGIFGGVTAANLDRIFGQQMFCAYKVYLGSTTGDLLFTRIDQLPASPKPLCFHAEKESIIVKNREKNGPLQNAWQHSQTRSEDAAIEATREIIEKQKSNGGNYHVCHVSTAEEIELLAAAGLSFEVAPHHIFCSTDNYQQGGFLWKCNPPLRSPETARKLLAALHAEKIPMIATDHAPHPLADKTRQTPEPASGVPSLQLGSHLVLQEFARGQISAGYTASILAGNAALKFQLQQRGQLREGYFADIALVDEKEQWTFQPADVLSACGWSPFAGWQFTGRVKATLVNGVYYDNSRLPEIFAAQEASGQLPPVFEAG